MTSPRASYSYMTDLTYLPGSTIIDSNKSLLKCPRCGNTGFQQTALWETRWPKSTRATVECLSCGELAELEHRPGRIEGWRVARHMSSPNNEPGGGRRYWLVVLVCMIVAAACYAGLLSLILKR